MWFPFCHKILTRHPLYLEYTTLDCAILDCSPQVWSCYSLYIGSPSSRAWASLLDVSIALALAPFLGVCADAASVAPLLPQNMYFYMEYTSFDCARLSHRWCHATHHILALLAVELEQACLMWELHLHLFFLFLCGWCSIKFSSPFAPKFIVLLEMYNFWLC